MKQSEFEKLLYNVILNIKTEQECKNFFEGICTPKEIKAMSQRLAVAKMLNDKNVYEKIVKETGASTATVSRVSRATLPAVKKLLERAENNV